MTRRRMAFRDALDLVPDDLPDGAFFAMAHEMAGLDYGEGFDELAMEASPEELDKREADRKERKRLKARRRRARRKARRLAEQGSTTPSDGGER